MALYSNDNDFNTELGNRLMGDHTDAKIVAQTMLDQFTDMWVDGVYNDDQAVSANSLVIGGNNETIRSSFEIFALDMLTEFTNQFKAELKKRVVVRALEIAENGETVENLTLKLVD